MEEEPRLPIVEIADQTFGTTAKSGRKETSTMIELKSELPVSLLRTKRNNRVHNREN